MATASDLKQKVAKISTIVEYLEDEQINQIEKDILLQAIRDLYTDILLTKVGDTAVEKDECEKIAEEENNVNEPQENIAESSVDVPPVIAVAFDGGEINFSNLMGIDDGANENVDSIAENTEADADAVAATETIVQEKEPESMSECVAQEVSQESESVAEEITEVATADVPMGECIVSEVEENVANEEPTIIEDDIKPQGDNSMAYSYEQTNTVDSVMDVAEVNETPSVEDNVALSSCEEPQPVPVVEETPVVEDIPHVQVEAGEEEKEEPQPVHIEQPQNIEEKPIQSMEETVVAAEPEKVEPTRLTLGEQLGQTRQESLNDKFANNKSADLSSRIGLKPISDIRSSIGLGERYRFTRMLFSGNGSAYDAAVAKLNEMSSIEEAENYVRTNFYWDMESPIVADFMNIVRRRYL